tara:strand:+ start:3438 stop:4058 length:621 start_codon:yes stop_codon:yes gene_type:complete
MEIKKIAICGDSYMCLDINHAGTHFSELLHGHYSVINLARAGVSQVEIGFQLKKAIELKPDYIMVNTTTPDRIDIPIADTDSTNSLELEHFRPGNKRCYLSSNILTLIHGKAHNEFRDYLTDDQIDALKKYMTYIYDHKLRKEVDSWIIGYWLGKLQDNGIRYHLFDETFIVYREHLQRPIYHTSYQTQIEAAKWVNSHLDRIFNA